MKELDFKTLYLAQGEHDIANVLTSIGITVSIGGTVILWAHTFGDLGAEPESLDCTPLSAKVSLSKSGLQQMDTWTLDYWFNKPDYQALQTLIESTKTESKEVVIQFDDGTKFTNQGRVTSNYLTGQSVGQVAEGHATVELSNPEGWVMVEVAAGNG